MKELTITGKSVVEGTVAGEAVVSLEPVGFNGGIDPKTGEFVERGHPLCGTNVKGKIMVFPTGKGSTGGSYILYAANQNGVGPAGIVMQELEPIIVIGAIISEIPLISVSAEEMDKVHTGDMVELDASRGVATIRRP